MKTFTSPFKSTREIIKFPDPPQLARDAAANWLMQLESERDSGKIYLVALSGGRIARLFFSAVTERARQQRKLLDRVHFFWGDERCVPPDDPESNFGMALELLLKPLGIPQDCIHRIKGEEEPRKAAVAAEAELRQLAPTHHVAPSPGLKSPPEAPQPVFDMIFLGMGEEGHVASLFPGESEETMSHPAVYRPVVASKPPPQRITLGYAAIAAATQVWLLASGEGKEKALRESLTPEGRSPLARVLRSREQTRIFSDISTDA
ncbi:MAG: 6-phosphogluconolactonase [Verrucomicrobia bacterium]|nr:MAG: 6-phosphogluconolactonase [Verrucomicrobiota bacterium]